MRDLEYYMDLDYPIEVYAGEHEIGDAFLAVYTDFDIKGASEDYEEAKLIAREYLKQHIKKQLELGKEIPKPREGVRFMSHREALKAYKEKDYDSALSIWNKEAELKNDQAMANLGLMYLKGEGVEKDFLKAKEWFEKGSSYGNDSANYNLALMYQGAIGIEENIEKAILHFREATLQNHQGANFRLGLLLLKDRTDKELVAEGFECMLKAARTGHPMAMTQMGGVDKPANKECEINKEFRVKSTEEQLEIIEDAIERYIRPILVKDGGDMMILDFKNEPDIEIRLAYQGACAGCSLGATSTYDLIRGTLSQVIDDNIQIFII